MQDNESERYKTTLEELVTTRTLQLKRATEAYTELEQFCNKLKTEIDSALAEARKKLAP